MIVAWPLGAKFFQELLRIDEQATQAAQRGGCPRCGERLDRPTTRGGSEGSRRRWNGCFRTD